MLIHLYSLIDNKQTWAKCINELLQGEISRIRCQKVHRSCSIMFTYITVIWSSLKWSRAHSTSVDTWMKWVYLWSCQRRWERVLSDIRSWCSWRSDSFYPPLHPRPAHTSPCAQARRRTPGSLAEESLAVEPEAGDRLHLPAQPHPPTALRFQL